MSNWIKSNPIKSGLVAASLALVALASWAEMAGRFDEPCAQSEHSAKGDEKSPGFTLTISKKSTTYEYRPQPQHECPEPDWWNIPLEGWIALFTVVLAFSTIGLWWATYLLGERADKGQRTLERAYMFAGPILETEGMAFQEMPANHIPGMFAIFNYGKTPGFLRETYFRSMSVKEMPEAPSYPRFREWPILSDQIVPQDKKHKIARMALDTKEDTLLWGYVKYVDIFDKEHTSRFCFILKAHALREDPPFIFFERHGAPAWNAWD